ncbi:MAG: serine/threonine-protein phosphatase [Chloroflexaceae bacterium]|nr:serine/threonine-protein phosphatase [Chloroflexaceae bacterium]
MKIFYSASTDTGRQRQVNQDSFDVSDAERSEQLGQLLVVCDGMGGHLAGEIASQLGVEMIMKSFYEAPHDAIDRILQRAFQEANDRIYRKGKGAMGTTGVAALLFDNMVYVANVGDSRAYLVRGGTITQITHDHSLVQEQIDANLLTPEEARHSHYRNMITRALGHRPDVEVDLFEQSVQEGDILILSSDGMHGLIDDDEIAQIVETMTPGQAVYHLSSACQRARRAGQYHRRGCPYHRDRRL